MSEFVRQTIGKITPYLAMAIAALFAIGALLWLYEDIGVDFSVYWRVAHESVAEAYAPRAHLPFAYPPTMLLWVFPLYFLPQWPAYILWSGLGIFAMVVACRGQLRWQEIALALVSPPAFYCLMQGQVSLILAGLLIWSCVTTNRYAAGIALAVVASIKPQMVLLAPLMLLAAKDWRALAGGAGASAGILAASLIAFGLEGWQTWLGSLDHFQAVVEKNGVLVVAITPASIAQGVGWPVIPIIAIGAVVGSWLVFRCRQAEPVERAAAIATGSLLAAPYALIYDLAPLMPFLALSIFRGRILSVVAFSGGLSPAPLLVTAFLLISPETRQSWSASIGYRPRPRQSWTERLGRL